MLLSRWVLGALMLSFCYPVRAIPTFTLLTGNRCIACHVSPTGGGLRSELGWYTMHDVGILQWHQLGFEWLEQWWQRQGNSFWGGRLLLGVDARLQGFQSHNPTLQPRWRLFPMQGALHIGMQPIKAVSAEATLNGGRLIFPGQQRWSGSITFQPLPGLPQLRAGFFQPAVGLRYDDHTMLVRRLPGARYDSPQETYLLAPNFAQWGAHLQWFSLPWLSLTVGAFRAGALADVRLRSPTGQNSLTAAFQPVWNGHLWVAPSTTPWTFSLGASWLGNRDFALWNAFAGAGWIDRFAIWAEASSLRTPVLRRRTLTAEASFWLWNAVLPYLRVEHGVVTEPAFTTIPYTTQLALGAQLFVLPFVEVRPEYRWADTEAYRSGRVAVQLHVFY
ncbi:MAG: hypothetical protein NZ473_07665 [Candidatus Kapabacteria bacterium]|nr:hypothetical protein [Candidatus Kapabacteria bacterium]MCS7169205.1 hypothetical protein [Candidatus Kapabacteria bacterium]MDW7996504.1 hypothetical protein [Bacteroidota bacterium]MDW8226048.1 hypothetical protein [Bacteroidota bacterium]